MRHARAARSGIGLLALIGAGQAATALMLAVGLTSVVAGSRTTGPALVALAYPARALLAWAEQVVAQRTAARATDELRRSTLDATLRHGPAWVARFGTGRLIAALTTGLESLRPWFSGYLPAVILGVALPPLVVIAMAVVDPASAIITVLTLPLVPILGALIGWATQARARQRWDEDARLAGHFLDVVRGLATLRVFGRAARQTRVIAAMTTQHRTATMRVLRVAFLSSTALDLLGTLSVGLIAVGAGLRVAAGDMNLAPALLVILLAPEAYRPLREAASRYHASAAASAVITDLDEVLTASPAAASDSHAAAAGPLGPAGPAVHTPAALWTEPENRRTSALHSHPPMTGVGEVAAPAKNDLELRASAGPRASAELRADARLQTHAGLPADARLQTDAELRTDARPQTHPGLPADAGLRTDTQIQTLARLRPDAGTPAGDGLRLVGGREPGVWAAGLRVRHPGMRRDALRLEELVVRPGEIVALRGFSGAGKTTALRVLAGLQAVDAGFAEVAGPEAVYLPQRPVLPHARTVADVAGVAALRAVGLDRELSPDTPLGEHAGGVSAGQRQRLALAATLSRAAGAPRVLLLDEPTAHLDAASERRVVAKLRAAADRGCAVLVVAHRAALLAAADRTVLVVTPSTTTENTNAENTNAENTNAENTNAENADAGGTDAGGADAGGARMGGADAQDTSGMEPEGTPTAETGRGRASAAAATVPEVTGTRPQAVDDADPALDNGPAGVSTRPGEDGVDGEEAVGAGVRARLGMAAVGLGAGSWLAGIVLTGAAAWLLVRASALPPVLTLSAAVVLVRGSAVARPLLRYAERLVSHQVAFARLGARRAAVYAGLIPHVPGPRVRRRGELLSRVVDDVDADVDGTLRGVLPALAAAVAGAVGVGVVAAVRPVAAIPVGAGLVVAGVLAPLLAVRLERRREAAVGAARDELRDAVVETVDGIEELRGAGALRVPVERSRLLAAREARAAREAGLATALAHLGWGVAVAGAAPALLPGAGLEREWAAVLLLGVVALAEPVAVLPDAALAFRRARAARERLAEVTAEAEVAADGRRTPRDGSVVVKGLVAGWDRAVLDGFELELPAGSRTAILGPSGSGKSTLAAVLARFLTPRAGTVELGGAGIESIGDDALRRHVALVGDETEHVFASTVRENLRLARPAATDDELAAVLRRVGLELGLDRRLGTGGSTISGGQRKRLATARALLAGPRLLILDEPTEGLDRGEAEALMADLLGAAGERTVLVLTHRTDGLHRVPPERIRELSAPRGR
ncbi:thiol reductant ABC exporter subunit CydC [Actinoplanes sp. NBRC 103695]|uniref:thiol reductant ABC exporter subunit CydC n=1 Tax=Actinoplanes sp. NBRC 103695 TaxID=3032202 RepID=UPI0025567AA4|nr:thiol reductant ABC exporter subunit CydC [Actinoplanes sp. NBRC 103695]